MGYAEDFRPSCGLGGSGIAGRDRKTAAAVFYGAVFDLCGYRRDQYPEYGGVRRRSGSCVPGRPGQPAQFCAGLLRGPCSILFPEYPFYFPEEAHPEKFCPVPGQLYPQFYHPVFMRMAVYGPVLKSNPGLSAGGGDRDPCNLPHDEVFCILAVFPPAEGAQALGST